VEVANCTVPHSALLKVICDLKKEDMIIKSSKGPLITSLADTLAANAASEEVTKLSDFLVHRLQLCLNVKHSKNMLSKV